MCVYICVCVGVNVCVCFSSFPAVYSASRTLSHTVCGVTRDAAQSAGFGNALTGSFVLTLPL